MSAVFTAAVIWAAVDLNTLAAYTTILSAGILIGGGIVRGVWRVWTWRQKRNGSSASISASAF